MSPTFVLVLVLVVCLCVSHLFVAAQPLYPASHITVTGSVFCDVCHDNSFTKQSYFLPGADVHVQCRFQANAPATTEQIMFSVNRTTNRYGVYRLDIPSVEGVDCVDGPAIQSFCEATLIRSSVLECNVPAVSATSKEITVKSRSSNVCVYSVSALSYRPLKRNLTVCGTYGVTLEEEKMLSDSFNFSKTFLPYFPWPFPSFPPWPSLPPLPPLPQLPPFPSLPPFPLFPPFPPYFQFPPMSPLPSLPPLPQLPPLTSTPPQPPSFQYPPSNFPPVSRPPTFNPGDPRSWQPNIPSFSPPAAPPPFDPRSWMPRYPFVVPPPPPPGFDLRDPRTWIPTNPPSPNSPQSEQP